MLQSPNATLTYHMLFNKKKAIIFLKINWEFGIKMDKFFYRITVKKMQYPNLCNFQFALFRPKKKPKIVNTHWSSGGRKFRYQRKRTILSFPTTYFPPAIAFVFIQMSNAKWGPTSVPVASSEIVDLSGALSSTQPCPTNI